ncbi:hypothetical protein M885DRAFT_617759 [Pelagophyceae sp. CCMP2097]|nr:hypothetical protein M885DRAFT_617759 [Pelagophyceae sp. CCMP2097]
MARRSGLLYALVIAVAGASTPWDKVCFVRVTNHTRHFWHFMMGEFLPALEHVSRLKCAELHVYGPGRIWGAPIDRFWHDVEDCAGRDRPLKVHLETQLVPGANYTQLEAWDTTWHGHLPRAKKGIAWLRARVKAYWTDQRPTADDDDAPAVPNWRALTSKPLSKPKAPAKPRKKVAKAVYEDDVVSAVGDDAPAAAQNTKSKKAAAAAKKAKAAPPRLDAALGLALRRDPLSAECHSGDAGFGGTVVQVRGRTPDSERTYYRSHFCRGNGESNRDYAADMNAGKCITGSKAAGAEKRSVANFKKLGALLAAAGVHEVALHVPNSTQHLYAQVRPYLCASVVVLEHGAGMFYTLFLPPAAPRRATLPPLVVEVVGPEKDRERGAARGVYQIAEATGAAATRVVISRESGHLSNRELISILAAIRDWARGKDVADHTDASPDDVQRITEGIMRRHGISEKAPPPETTEAPPPRPQKPQKPKAQPDAPTTAEAARIPADAAPPGPPS